MFGMPVLLGLSLGIENWNHLYIPLVAEEHPLKCPEPSCLASSIILATQTVPAMHALRPPQPRRVGLKQIDANWSYAFQNAPLGSSQWPATVSERCSLANEWWETGHSSS